MPFVVVEGPAIRDEGTRRELVEDLTRVVALRLAVDPCSVVVLVKEQGGRHMIHTAAAFSAGGRQLSCPTSS